jgi:hypothetical protein
MVIPPIILFIITIVVGVQSIPVVQGALLISVSYAACEMADPKR